MPSLPGAAVWNDSDVAGPLSADKGMVAPPADRAMPTIGHIGRYALKYQLGAGGLGTVFAAHDPLLSRLIAVKTLNLEIKEEERESFNALFINEARAAGGLSHPHIVTVFDAGISDNRAYIAMELLKGRDLRQLRQEGWRATPAQAALIVRRVADALAFAHSKGVIHRDIKPANIFMVGRTQPRVLDFGIARITHQRDGNDAMPGAGSPYYMPPEQLRRQPADRRADVFSLGVVLYELLTDQKPFRGETLKEIATAVLTHDPPLACKIDKNVPKALAVIAERAMAKDPDHRFRSARSFARELRKWLDANPAAPDGEASAQPAPASRRRTTIAVAAGLAILGAVGGIAWWQSLAAKEQLAIAFAPVLSLRNAGSSRLGEPAAATVHAGALVTSGGPAIRTSPVPSASTGTTQTVPTAASSRGGAPAAVAGTSPEPGAAADVVLASSVELAAPPPPVAPTGTVKIAISPWGQVDVDGMASGVAPPLSELTLAEGRHKITIRNGKFTPYVATIELGAGQVISLQHRFGF